ncbi:EAL domain-containing protein [Litoribacillus peritrichatus]|uniref:EAL domain-containing protein n=1 Tax=Litoribacillus peritrichatus TaxID=718191 RepID=UPI0031CF2B84
MLKTLVFLVLITFSWVIQADVPPLELDSTQDKASLRGHFLALEDPENQLSFGDILNNAQQHFKPIGAINPNFGFSTSTFWLKAKISAPKHTGSSNDQHAWILTSSYAPLKELEVIFYDESQRAILHHWKTGTERSFYDRPVEHRGFVFPFELKQNNELTLYVKARSDTSIQLPLTVWKPEKFFAKDSYTIYYWGLYFGIMLSLLAYNSLMYAMVRNASYAYYLIYVVGLSGVVLFLNGQGFQFFWPDFQLWNSIALPFFTGVTLASGAQFGRLILKSEKLTPQFDKIMLCLIGIGVLIALTPFVGLPQLPQVSGYLGGLLPLILLIAGIFSLREGNQLAVFFISAWVCFLLGLTCYLLNVFGYLPTNALTSNALQIGSAGEVTLLSFAQAFRMKLERQKRFDALKNENEAVLKWQQAEKHLLHQAQHHPLTLLPNHSLLSMKINELLKHTGSNRSSFAIILIHINRFSEINKTLGKINADQILIQAADRIHLSTLDIQSLYSLEVTNKTKYNVAMLDNATFACITDTTGMRNTAGYITEQIQQSISVPINFQGMSISLDCSAGIANFPEDGLDSETLLKHAEVAMTLARKHRKSVAVYNPLQDSYSTRRLKLMGELHHAIDQNQLSLYFQPQIDSKSRMPIAFEALLRWTHPTEGYIPPTEIITLAEQCGLMKSITQWVIAESLTFGNTLDRLGYNLKLAINISPNNLHEHDFASSIRQALQVHQYNPTKMVLEFSESSIIDFSNQAEKTLLDLKKLGVQLSLDQFGSGHSSLSKLKTIPLNQVKISPELVLDISNESNTKNIVETIIKLGHLLGIPCVAVGAENLLLTDCLTAMHCDALQGNYIAAPMSQEAIFKWLENHLKTAKETQAKVIDFTTFDDGPS